MTAEPLSAPSPLRFIDETHTYILNGKVVPSVTGVLADAGLVDYSYVLDYYRERGSAAHAAIHAALEDDLDESRTSPELLGYVAAARAALAELRAEIIAVETRVYSLTYQYAGTADVIAWVYESIARQSRRRVAIDWKTFLDHRDVVGLQLAGYADAYFEMTGNRVGLRYSVGLASSGRFAIHPHTDRADGDSFRSALTVANLRRRYGII